MEAGGEKPQAEGGAEESVSGPAREMSLHLLRMFETRLEAAGIAFHGESNRLVTRVQLQLLAAAACFIAIWGGIVLLAIALPQEQRVLALSVVTAGFVLLALWAVFRARRLVAGQEVGSMNWFIEALKQDLDVLSRSLAESASPAPKPAPTPSPEPTQEQGRPPSDIAA